MLSKAQLFEQQERQVGPVVPGEQERLPTAVLMHHDLQGVNGQHGTWVQDWSERDDLRMCEDLVQVGNGGVMSGIVWQVHAAMPASS
jgi:hypothetical protein